MAYNRFLANWDNLSSISREDIVRGAMMRVVFSTHTLTYRDACKGTEYEKPIAVAFAKVWRQYGREYLWYDRVPLKERIVLSLAWNSPLFWEYYKKKKQLSRP